MAAILLVPTVGPNVECRYRQLRSVPKKCHFHNLCMSIIPENVRKMSILTRLIVGTLRQLMEKCRPKTVGTDRRQTKMALTDNSKLLSVPITNHWYGNSATARVDQLSVLTGVSGHDCK